MHSVATYHRRKYIVNYFNIFLDSYKGMKYKERNNLPSSVNQISLVHNHEKAGNKCYTQDNKNTQENTSVRIGA